jgi:hypothetical protein
MILSRLFLFLFIVPSIYPSTAHAQKVGVEVWIRGSDIETPRHATTMALRDALEAKIRHSSSLYLSTTGKSFVRITIPGDVIIATGDGITYIMYDIDVTYLGNDGVEHSTGYCRQNEIEACAQSIVAIVKPTPPKSPSEKG